MLEYTDYRFSLEMKQKYIVTSWTARGRSDPLVRLPNEYQICMTSYF